MSKEITLLIIDRSPLLCVSLLNDSAMSSFDIFRIDDIDTAWQALNVKNDVDIIIIDSKNNTDQEIRFVTKLRSSESTAFVLILSASDTSSECVRCLSAGADDFMRKPYVYTELIARVSSLARNAQNTKTAATPVTHENLQLDLGRFSAKYKKCDLHLTKTEFRVLNAIAHRKGRAISHEALIEELYGCEFELSRNSIEVHISAIRRKLGAAGAPATLHTRRGFGYFIA